ncbi:N-acetylmuramoyl-L-alanine amidase [Clostridium weizhouense]|uniref:N-acetylmuramoyl-L-alanine amidase n=1 Tax=Clostridium weizhouense TaxID=2859781 RepID=A0ABS7AQ67_9CLOT|nr:N-acetylmuramoyl-L-alanine amidase [Clostridium weizhouense]MBW6410774.1 N-acetylmuramoyl-L-alanine amidase [Clostridium weizhouense]
MTMKNKIASFLIAFVMLIGLIPTTIAEAAVTDINIISDTSITANQAKKWAKTKGASEEFLELADLYWKYSQKCGNVNPAIAYVQAGKETAFGNFGGVLDANYHNPCGMKTSQGGGDKDKNAHKKFDSWDEGVQAHLDHLALYAGADGYPKQNTYDPRHFISIKGKAKTVNSLGGKWAPSLTYGEEVNNYYRALSSYLNIDLDDSNTDDEEDDDSSSKLKPGSTENKPGGLVGDLVINFEKPVIPQPSNEPKNKSTIGWKNEDGDWYYYNSDNIKEKGWIKPDSNWYYLDDSGKMRTGWINYSDSWYYFNDNGTMVIGWKQINNKWYYMQTSGAMATGFICDRSDLYYLEKSGAMYSTEGWISVDKKWYYIEKSGKLKLGWLSDNGSSYYMQGDGSMVTGVKSIDGKTYCFNDSGKNITGWISVNNNWYYLNRDSQMLTGWINPDGNYYYLYDTGAMAKGWLELDGTWYYLNSNGTMATGWVQSGSNFYYLDKTSGKVLTNTTVDGYKIGADGKRKSNDSSNNSNGNKPSVTPNPGNNTNNGGKELVVIDPGHNFGGDDGAYATHNRITYSERDLNMQVSIKLKSYLESKGYTVVMTRNESDRETLAVAQSLDKRVNLANGLNADFFVSIHHNSAEAASANGIEVFYSTNPQDSRMGGRSANQDRILKSKAMATSIVNKICNNAGFTNRGAKDQNLNVCRNTNMPAVLVECGFITNPSEAAKCADSNNQSMVASSIAEAIASELN